jgi:hypothetical protein
MGTSQLENNGSLHPPVESDRYEVRIKLTLNLFQQQQSSFSTSASTSALNDVDDDRRSLKKNVFVERLRRLNKNGGITFLFN